MFKIENIPVLCPNNVLSTSGYLAGSDKEN